jgi:hypothetical protein
MIYVRTQPICVLFSINNFFEKVKCSVKHPLLCVMGRNPEFTKKMTPHFKWV